MSCSFGALGYAAQILADQPLGYWRLDETSGIKSQTDAQRNGQRDHETGGRAMQPRAPQTIEVDLESSQEQQEREPEQG